MPVLPLLADPTSYVPCDWDLTADSAGRRYWVAHFMEHLATLERLIRDVYDPPADRLDAFRREYLPEWERILNQPGHYGRLTILALDRIRDQYLRRFGYPDPFRNVKAKENDAALLVYPRLIAELDSRPPDRRLGELIEGVFAGNIFDMGAMATVKQYHENGLDFFATRGSLAHRPWLEDDLDLIARRWSPAGWRYRKVLFFVDNAGCDFVLGCLPLIREFACNRVAPAAPPPPASAPPPPAGAPGPPSPSFAAGPQARGPCHVVVAVNSGPSLNDILADEADAALRAARQADPPLDAALAAGRIRVVPSGNTAPLIDLADVSDELAAEAADADLLILEGMGRSVESNHYARFTVDTAKLALLKDPRVAARVGGKLFDICCRFEPGAPSQMK